ncbi:MAG: tripartite tricarboxylate transporter substrate binding protein [Ramlibacter sp.]|nr:tripartite tricarboxylate transporter substrate binding protein [Ramlibacter sp.]
MNAFHCGRGAMLPMRARLALPAALFASAFAARAQNALADYPNKPVRWIVPTSAGAGTDAAARSFAKVAGEAWKQPVVVDNRSGASGMIGLDMLAAAPPDGYTLGFMSVSQFLDATLLNKYVFDAQKDFTPISMLASTPLLLLSNAETRIDTLPQLIAAAKARPKALNYASGGTGGITHFAMEVFLRRAGIQVTHVAYKGSGPAVIDLLSGQVQIGFSTPAAVLQHVKSGRLRALAVASPTRSPLAPEVPTFAEQGLDGLNLTTWYGLFGPANMAPELVERIARSISAGVRPAAVRDKMVGDGFEPILSAPADFAKFLKADREQWLGVAKAINFKREN